MLYSASSPAKTNGRTNAGRAPSTPPLGWLLKILVPVAGRSTGATTLGCNFSFFFTDVLLLPFESIENTQLFIDALFGIIASKDDDKLRDGACQTTVRLAAEDAGSGSGTLNGSYYFGLQFFVLFHYLTSPYLCIVVIDPTI
jgi:hypothetical protein